MKIAILGFGTVGQGVFEMIEKSIDFENSKVLVRKGKDTEAFKVSDIDDIAKDDSIDAVVECIGGITPAFDYVKACLENSKSVVTSNKALVASKGLELQEIADKHNCGFLFSAACGGAIPVLHNLSIAKQTDEIISVSGIINGTTNFILSGLEDKTFCSYSQALKKAQELGYAEADPTSDVSGLDTLRKVILLSAVGFDTLLTDGFCCEGIENIDLYKGSKTVKLIGQCGKNNDSSVYAYVHPVLCSCSPFKSVSSNFNQILYNAKNAGTISLFGQGAGRYPTSSAVLRDLTALHDGQKRMISPSCKKDVANNSFLKRTFLIVENGKEEVKDLSILQMHEFASSEREKGNRLFFAEIGD